MGLVARNNNQITYVQLVKGNFRVAQRNADGSPKKDAQGNTLYDLFKELSGRLSSVATRKRTTTIQGSEREVEDLLLNIVDDKEQVTYILEVDVNGQNAENIIMALASATSFSGKEIKIFAWPDKKGDKVYTKVSIHLNGARLDWAVEPDNRPAIRKIKYNGQEVSDRTDRINFVKEYISKIQAILAADTTQPVDDAAAAAGVGVDGFTEGEPEDDLPM